MRNDFGNNYLAHFGIMGMKWGGRRYQNPDGSLTPAGKERYGSGEKVTKSSEGVKKLKNVLKSDSGSRSSKAYREARKKDIDELSTSELKEINNRLNEEKRYQDLTKGNISDGKRFAKEMARNIASGIVVGIGIEVGKKYVKNKLHI